MCRVVTLGALLLTTFASAANLTPTLDLENANVLPRGVRNPRYKNIFMSMEERYNTDGGIEALGAKLNKTVSWTDIINAQETETQRMLVQGTLSANSLSESGSPGETTGTVNTFVDVKVPIFAIGITDKLTLAAALPIYRVDVSAETGFVKSSDGQAFVDAVALSDPRKATEAASKLVDPINSKLSRLGYDPIESTTITGIGDAKLVGKYQVFKNEKHAFAVKPALTFPTGTEPNADKALDIPTGDGQWDIGTTLVWDHYLASWLTFSQNAGINAQLADKIDRRLPVSAEDSLSDDKELVDRDLGDQYSIGTSLTFGNSSKGLSFSTGYAFQYMNKATYQGTAYEDSRYRLLEDLTPLQSVHNVTLMAGFATIDWFKEKKFFYPFQFLILYSKPFSGQNVATSDVLAAELVLFF